LDVGVGDHCDRYSKAIEDAENCPHRQQFSILQQGAHASGTAEKRQKQGIHHTRLQHSHPPFPLQAGLAPEPSDVRLVMQKASGLHGP